MSIYGIPEGYALVPKEMLLDREVIEAIIFHCVGTEEEGEDKWVDGRLYIGNATDDDDSVTYGLHILTDEYPEEGCSLLCELKEKSIRKPTKEAVEAFNEICKLLGGRWPDAKMEQEAPNAYKFFVAMMEQDK